MLVPGEQLHISVTNLFLQSANQPLQDLRDSPLSGPRLEGSRDLAAGWHLESISSTYARSTHAQRVHSPAKWCFGSKLRKSDHSVIGTGAPACLLTVCQLSTYLDFARTSDHLPDNLLGQKVSCLKHVLLAKDCSFRSRPDRLRQRVVLEGQSSQDCQD
jgi:hypothetical protein